MTLANAALGLYAIYTQSSWGIALIGIAMLLDLGDGLVARLLNAQSEIGVQLDSMADLISFGIAPVYLLYHLLPNSQVALGICILYSVGAVYRLAKFNTLEYSSEFVGLPSPAAAGIICGWIWLLDSFSAPLEVTLSLVAATALLMNAPFPFFSLKGKRILQDWRIWTIIITVIAACIIDYRYSVFAGFGMYGLLSLVDRLISVGSK